MRVLLGLAALAATTNAAVQVTLDNASSNQYAASPNIGQTALARISVYEGAVAGVNPASNISPGGQINSNTFLTSSNWRITVLNAIDKLTFVVTTNNLTGQLQHRWSPNYPSPALAYPGNNLSAQSYTCDSCSSGNGVGTPISCSTATGPGASPSPTAGFPCSSLTRTYYMTGLEASTKTVEIVNSFAVQLFDIITTPAPNVSSYSFTIIRSAPPVVGDPEIYGMQGQDFQVHGIPDEIFNMITYPNLQVNARFVYLSEGACHDNFTACFAHPGTYISEEGIRLGKDKIHVQAGSFKKGLTVSVNGKKLTQKKTSVKLGSVEIESHRRVTIKTPIMAITISNSDKFLNQETALFDQKLLALGKERRQLLIGESFHPEVPLHGLQGQTWRNVEYPSGLEYEGSVSDYHVTSGNLYGTEFVFNQFKH